jgi:hypothetical protein
MPKHLRHPRINIIMLFRKIPAVAVFLIFFTVFCYSQANTKVKPAQPPGDTQSARSSPAYAELLLRKTELQADLESLILEYTEEYPKVKEIRQTLTMLEAEAARLLAVKPAEASKLTLALGRLMVRKVELETDLWKLLRAYKEEHPDVKRAKRRVEIYENAIKEILG